ncbi:DUF4145 domain-containing protein [Paraburkholderia sediminicola]|uniref:DUF4145 domain-containing protein n=1 Tax=Paraburkholderia sediminicola TaxID=458836 RepID=UPI0038B966EB
MIHDTFARRFLELQDLFINMPYRAYEDGSIGRYVPNGFWRQWATSTESLIRAAFGEASPHCRNFSDLYAKTNEAEESVTALHAVFCAAKDDFEGGYVFDVDLRVSGEVFGDFVVLARHSLSEGHKDVAAVLASAALEDALKRYALTQGLDVGDKTMQDVVNLLKGAGLVGGAQKTLLDAMPKLRNAALHAQWDKLTEPDVNSIIGFVESFLLTKFSS